MKCNSTLQFALLLTFHFDTSLGTSEDELQCKDSTLKLGVKTNPKNNKLVFKTCKEWANTWRCEKFPGLKESCPASCNACEISGCKDSPFKFKYLKQNGEYSGKRQSCEWVANAKDWQVRRKRCRRPGVTETCREACLICVKQTCAAAYPNITWGLWNLGNGNCNNDPDFNGDGRFNSPECGFDGGDCLEFNANYPNCTYRYSWEIGNGQCMNNELSNSPECKYDGGDCDGFNEMYPNCTFEETHKLGDGQCRPNSINNTPECGYDGGDCIDYNARYPNCTVRNDEMYFLGNGRCEGRFNIPECGYEDGDCDEFNTLYPDCKVNLPYLVGDGYCRNKDGYNTAECGYDGGDCTEFNEKYPGCIIPSEIMIGDGYCYEPGNTTECEYDGGDCL